jgi:transposase
MLTVEKQEQIRRAYFIEEKSIRAICSDLHCAAKTVRKALASAEPAAYTLQTPRPAPVLGPYHERIAAFLAENATLPRKQRYTAHRIYVLLQAAGYPGAESTLRGYVAQLRAAQRRQAVYLPLEFEPGQDAQVDWGEAEVILQGQIVTVQLFVLRLCYSRRTFVMAFPAQTQEAFFAGHVAAFAFLGGVPQRLSYDNLKAAVQRVLQGHTRQEQERFIIFRSHYLFESFFCTVGQGHEKGGVESAVGYSRRNFCVPRPEATSYATLNAQLQALCAAEDARQVAGQPQTIGAAWAQERPHLRPLPTHAFDCCVVRNVVLNPYGQVTFVTNRYSVPAEEAQRQLTLKAYPFEIVILNAKYEIARHPRCYAREQIILDPLHYLSLLEQRPGAFAYAQPLRQWRATWPPIYERLLAHLQAREPGNTGVVEFVRILGLHRQYPAELLAQAVEAALAHDCAHLAGVTLLVQQLLHPTPSIAPVDLRDQPALQALAVHPPDLQTYDQLLSGGIS